MAGFVFLCATTLLFPLDLQLMKRNLLEGTHMKNPGIAAVLSFFWTGVGQIYNGQIKKGLILIGVQILNALLMFLIIGLITYPVVWIWGIFDAYKKAERINAGV